ncbi:hypothetical protein PhCBS80983_g00364 [Powellomyces hirtus]|uniref:Uncharacterized protein n=1 Tax=Powellomyces hirtus TaxID=109895 RepID=A0A507EEP1_9FUNG|nr:hypothetical protein PhCBS80983_g00364 [Powellomyces hirtus]
MNNCQDSMLSTDLLSYKPLPDEILRMSEAETACQYCGISYLLLSKYERMVEHVKGLEEHLVHLQDYAKERPTVLKQIETLESLHKASESTAQILRVQLAESQEAARTSLHELNESKRRCEELAERLERAIEKNDDEKDAKRQHMNKLIRHLSDIRADLLDQRREVNEMKASIRQSNSIILCETIPAIQKRLQADLSLVAQRQHEAFQERLQRKTKGEVGVMKKELDLVRDELQEANEKSARLSQELKQAKLQAEEHVNAQKSKHQHEDFLAVRQAPYDTMDVSDYAQGIRSTCLKLDDQLHAAKTLATNMTHERDKLASRYHNLEIRVAEERRMQNQDRQGMETQLKLLEGKLTMKEQELRETVEKHVQERRSSEDGSSALSNANRALAQKDEQLYALERSIRELHATTQSMRVERHKTVEAHQSRIKQLQDKFIEDLAVAGRTEADKREEELRRVFAIDKDEALRFLRESLTMEMHTVTDRLNRQMEALQHAKDQSDAKSVRQIRSVEEGWERKHAIVNEQLNKLKASNAADFAHYQARIRALEEQLAEASAQQHQRPTSGPVDPKQLAELKSLVHKRDAEIGFLKDMVRVECEERMGLVAELAHLKRGSGPIASTRTPPPLSGSKSPQVAYRPSSGVPNKVLSSPSMPQLPTARESSSGPAHQLEPGERSFQALMKAAAAKKGKVLAARSSMDLSGKSG